MLLFQPVHTPCTCYNTTEYIQECNIKIEQKIEYKTPDHRVIKQYPSKLGYNCLDYAKSRAYVPTGVSTLNQKLSKITSHEPKEGLVGVTAEGAIGHFVIIEQVKKDTVIISEGNYKHGYITWREISKSKIKGYL
jgi:hypothetical protein